MPEFVSVGMGEGHVRVGEGSVLVALGLGSCVAVCLYDPISTVAAMAHVMLPVVGRDASSPFRFADSAVPGLVAAAERAGALRSRLVAAMAGGAQMFGGAGISGALDIGARNIVATHQALAAAGLRLAAEDVGGSFGRSVYVHADSGRVIVRAIGQPERELVALGLPQPAEAAGGRPAFRALARVR